MPQKWIQTPMSDEVFEEYSAHKKELGQTWTEYILSALAHGVAQACHRPAKARASHFATTRCPVICCHGRRNLESVVLAQWKSLTLLPRLAKGDGNKATLCQNEDDSYPQDIG